MSQADNSGSFYMQTIQAYYFNKKDAHPIEYQLKKHSSNLCEWFIDNKLSIHFGEEKTKCLLFSYEQKLK